MTAPPPLTAEAFIEANVRVAELLRGYADVEEEKRARARATRAAARGLNPAGGVRQLAAVLAAGDRSAALGALKAPTLVIHGVDDPLVPVEGGKATARAIPGAKLLLLERMGHTLPRAAVAGPCRRHRRPRAGARRAETTSTRFCRKSKLNFL